MSEINGYGEKFVFIIKQITKSTIFGQAFIGQAFNMVKYGKDFNSSTIYTRCYIKISLSRKRILIFNKNTIQNIF